MSIREEVERSWAAANATIVKTLHGIPGWPQAIRYQWPLKIFEWVCSCKKGWGDYDCSHCDFGYIGNEANECVKRNTSQLLVRRNFLHLSEQERLNLIRLMEMSKNEEKKRWATIASVPDETNGYYNLQNVSTYDMMTFIHVLSGRENENSICPNVSLPNPHEVVYPILFAHQATPFLPWHRYFVLQFESELRRIGERMGIHDFTLPYWDWTPTSNCVMFTHEMFGIPEHSYDTVVNVSGAMFENGKWPVVCDLVYRIQSQQQPINHIYSECATNVNFVCDIEGDRAANRPLQRGAWSEDMRSLWLPDYKLIALTLHPDQFEGHLGFSNRLEGHVELCSAEAAKCMFIAGGGLNMHGIVHDFLGGHLSVGGPSANDPAFFPHHANVDRIYDRWLQKYNGTPPSYQPITGGPPGHNLNDYMVPMFPVRKIADFYKESKELGYIYDELPWSIASIDFQLGCPNEQCNKGGYPPVVLENSMSTYCTGIRKGQKLSRRA